MTITCELDFALEHLSGGNLGSGIEGKRVHATKLQGGICKKAAGEGKETQRSLPGMHVYEFLRAWQQRT